MPTDFEREEWLRNPPPGSAAAAARDYGTDLTITILNLRRTPEERIRKLDDFRDGIAAMKASAKWLTDHAGN